MIKCIIKHGSIPLYFLLIYRGKSIQIIKLLQSCSRSLNSFSIFPPKLQPRLRCLHHIVKSLPGENEAFIVAVLPEIILCIKEINQKARASAFGLLVEIGNTMLKHSDQPRECNYDLIKYLMILTLHISIYLDLINSLQNNMLCCICVLCHHTRMYGIEHIYLNCIHDPRILNIWLIFIK